MIFIIQGNVDGHLRKYIRGHLQSAKLKANTQAEKYPGIFWDIFKYDSAVMDEPELVDFRVRLPSEPEGE